MKRDARNGKSANCVNENEAEAVDPPQDATYSRIAPGRFWKLLIILAAASALVYSLTVPGNHTESDDGFAYAAKLDGRPIAGEHFLYYQFYHLLYMPIADALMAAVHSLGGETRPFELLVRFSIASSFVALVFFGLFLRYGIRFSPACSLAGVLTLGGGYGFWRYSCEAENYLPAIASVCTLLAWTFTRPMTPKSAALAALLATCSLVIHLQSQMYALIIVPMRCVLRKEWRAGALYLALTIVATSTLYATLLESSNSESLTRKQTLLERLAAEPTPELFSLALKKTATLPIGVAQNVLATNSLYGSDDLRAAIEKAFPDRYIAEEIFLGESIHPSIFAAAVLTLVAVLSMFAVGLSQFRARRVHERRVELLALGWGGAAALAIAVLAGDPLNCEHWMMSLPIIATFLTWLVLEPLERRSALLAFGTCGLLWAHSFVGGMLPIQAAESSFNHVKNHWLVENARSDDIIITARNSVGYRYLVYHTPACVVHLDYLTQEDLRRLQREIDRPDRRVFCWDIAFHHGTTENQRDFGKRLSAKSSKIVDDSKLSIWQYASHEYESTRRAVQQ